MLLDAIERETGAAPKASIIVLHGLGASGSDFESFVEELRLGSVGPVRFVFPHAPERPVTINGGYVMPAWYDIYGPTQLGREDEAGLRESQAQIEALIARERERGIPASKMVLAGFSQGCAMTLMTGLRYPETLAGLVCMSGYLPLAATTAQERNAANNGVPIFMAHGSGDPMIVLPRALVSRDALVALGYNVEWHQYPMPHSVCAEEVADLNRLLLRVLA
jgi:phospholipase/carboxylesterase